MTIPKMLPCPTCKTVEYLAVYEYEHGWKHVECDKCHFLGPGEGSKLWAVRSYNERARAALQPPAIEG